MKLVLVMIAAVLLSGCSAIMLVDPRAGYKSYDLCIRCGEKWDQFPNERYEAQKKRARGEVW